MFAHEYLRRPVVGVMIMNDKARLRKAICEMIKQNRITIRQAAEQCDICYDQMLRVYKKYILEGDAGLIHGNRGRTSNRKHSSHQEIINTYLEKYEGFGLVCQSFCKFRKV
jgi:transposase